MSLRTPYSSRPVSCLRSRAGFTLLEISVVITILGMLNAMAVPAYQRVQRNSRFSVLMNDYRVFATAFQQYYGINNTWPPYSKTKNAFPAGMQEYLRKTNWSNPTVYKGYYNWDYNITHNGKKVKAAIAIYTAKKSTVNMSNAEMLLFDKKFDDGSLTTGFFRKGASNCPLYIIEN